MDENEMIDINFDNNNNEINNMNNKPKKSKKGIVIIIILLLLVIGLGVFIYMKKDILFNTGNNTSENNNVNENNTSNNQTQNDNKPKELSNENKKKILDIIGLKENGDKRENIDEVENPDPDFVATVRGIEYIDYSALDIAPYLIDLDAGNHTVNDLKQESFESFLTIVSKNVDYINVFDDQNDPCSKKMAGVCKKISASKFAEIAKIYNINLSKSSELKKYKGYYILPDIGTLIHPLKISDNLVFSYDKDDVLITYDIHLTSFPGVDHFELNKKIVYRFKTLDDGSYYLYDFTITNN